MAPVVEAGDAERVGERVRVFELARVGELVDGSVGDLHIVRITSRDPAPPPIAYIKVSGGLFLDMMIHDFDMARFITGSEVVDVFAQAAVRVDPAIGEAGDVDTAVVMLRHENGCITTIDNSRQAVYGYDQRVEAFGSGGMAASENPLTHTGIRRSAAGTISQTVPYFFLDRYIPSYVEEWKAFAAYVTDGGASPVSANDGRAPLVIGLAAWKSYHEGRLVRCAEIG
jgi:myo-inositol 2-dehydrogenase/D-chiro-inositol 1-dehydrogenase